jgi:hypothetical protein
MKTPKALSSLDPLWVISFDHSLKGTIKDKAFFCISLPSRNKSLTGNLNDSEQFALDFLSQINDSFKKIAEEYLEQADQDINQKEQADDIREKFKSFDLWIE